MLRYVKTRFRPVHSTQHALVYLGGTAHSARCTRNEVITLSEPRTQTKQKKGRNAQDQACVYPRNTGIWEGSTCIGLTSKHGSKQSGGEPRTSPSSTYIDIKKTTPQPQTTIHSRAPVRVWVRTKTQAKPARMSKFIGCNTQGRADKTPPPYLLFTMTFLPTENTRVARI